MLCESAGVLNIRIRFQGEERIGEIKRAKLPNAVDAMRLIRGKVFFRLSRRSL